MDEIMNSDTSGWGDIGNTTFTSGTDSNPMIYATNTTSALAFTTNTTWDFLNNYYTWPKGVSDYSIEKKYTPKWHIKLGYKNQIKTMWD